MTDRRALARIRDEVLRRSRFLITSHARPDGDSIGSQLALAAALRTLGRQVEIVNRDAPPPHYAMFPGAADIRVAEAVESDYDAAFVMECSDLDRPGLAGLDRLFLINIDHHVGNRLYGAINWFDESAAACGEMVADLIDTLEIPWSREMAINIYVAILTDTGSFRHSNITARTFEICRRAATAGADAAMIARQVYDSSGIGRLKLTGALLDRMQLEDGGRVAVLYLDEALLRETACSLHDLEGLINLPLAAREVRAVVMFKLVDADGIRVSLRSKGEIDVRAIATAYGGGGHKNASGFTAAGSYDVLRAAVVDRLVRAVGAAVTDEPT